MDHGSPYRSGSKVACSWVTSSTGYSSETQSADTDSSRGQDCSTTPGSFYYATTSTSSKTTPGPKTSMGTEAAGCPDVGKVALNCTPKPRELWGWFLFNIGMSGYKMVLWVFFPLLIFSLFAASRENGSIPQCRYDHSDPRCLRVCDSLLEGRSIMKSSSDKSSTFLDVLSSGSFQPANLITAMLALSVMVQVAVFFVTSPLLDYGNMQNILLGSAAVAGGVIFILTINLFKASYWWVGAVLVLLSTIVLGIASTSYDRHFSCIARRLPVVKGLVHDRMNMVQTGRTQFENRSLLTGMSVGSLAGALCTMMVYVVYRSSLQDVNGVGNGFSLRFALSITGIWWVLWASISYGLLRESLEPEHPQNGIWDFLVSRHRIIAEDWRKRRNALYILAVCFLSSIASAVVFQSGTLCFSTRTFVPLVVLAQISSAAGSILFLFTQNVLCRSNKAMLLIVMLVQLLLPLYACVGFFVRTNSFGLKNGWEFVGFACVHGASLGAVRSYTKILFLESVPASMAGTYSSLLSLTTQLSSFVGCVLLLTFVHWNANLRYTFVLMVSALLVAIVLLVQFINSVVPGIAAIYEGTTDDDESLYPASMISGSVVLTSSSHDSSSPMSVGQAYPSEQPRITVLVS